MVIANLNITAPQGSPSFWEAFSQLHASFPTLNDAGGSGYSFNFPNMPISTNTSVSAIISTISFPEYSNTSEIDRIYKPVKQALSKIPDVKIQYLSYAFPSTQSFVHKGLLTGKTDTTGRIGILGSQLYSKELLLSEDGRDSLTKAWSSLTFGPGDQFVDHIVAGPGVAKNSHIESAVNPSWRKAVTHLLYARGWADNATVSQQQAVIRNMTEVELPIIHSVESDMGVYQNEASGYEPNFQKMFWGGNYDRLYEIKQKWDPNGLFIVRKGVGSEDWDDAGLCLKSHR